MAKSNTWQLVRLTDTEHIDTITGFHVSAFRKVLSGQIGRSFLRYYYKEVMQHGIIFMCLENNQPVGFISGITDENYLNTGGFYLRSMMGILTHIYNPSLCISLLRHIKRLIAFRHVDIRSELLSVVVKESHRGRGMGAQLIKALEDYFIENNICRYKVFTDMKYSTGYLLYEKTDFYLSKEVNLFSLPFRMYVKEIIGKKE